MCTTPRAIRPSAYPPGNRRGDLHSFLGVPILRAGNTLGVLVVQNRAQRTYYEEEVEALQTTAMVLAEMIASASCRPRPARRRADARGRVASKARPLSDGIALGHVVLHEPRVVVTKLIAEDCRQESQRLDRRSPSCVYLDRRCSRADDRRRRGEHRDDPRSLSHVRQ
ncbi:MAG: GAF domain-containing protein [Candidatus Kaistia colombiensis]|nr:MAG: GAF domain-containing protein [Kaistia sp.]